MAEPAPTAITAGWAARAGRITVSATAAMFSAAERLRAAGRAVVDFGVGEPDFATPEPIKEAAIAALRQNFTKYTPTAGTAELRAAIAAAHRRDFGSDYGSEEALVTVGGKQALFNALSVLVEHGDEVILPAPYWVSFRDQIAYAGGTPVVVATDEAQAFRLDFEPVAGAVTPRTKAIVLNSPANPSGAVFSPELFRSVLELCRERGIWLVSDECYAKLIYEGQPYSAAAEPGSREWLLAAGSLSKTYAMTGWRIGYALGPKPLIQAMLALQSQSTGNATAFAQKGAVAALTGSQEPVARMLEEYRRRRQLMVEGLRAIPSVTCVMPAGAFYAYPNIGALLGRRLEGQVVVTPLDFAAQLLERMGVVTVPGEAFGTDRHLRLSYATSSAVIGQGLERLAEFCALLK
ncbi:MAG: pyridoxal phosphate-dependent aminotransferase [Terriglobales bacterium]